MPTKPIAKCTAMLSALFERAETQIKMAIPMLSRRGLLKSYPHDADDMYCRIYDDCFVASCGLAFRLNTIGDVLCCTEELEWMRMIHYRDIVSVSSAADEAIEIAFGCGSNNKQ